MNDTRPVKWDRVAAALLLALGVLTVGTGAYFMFLRPAMLPEDFLVTGLDPQALQPAMADWLHIVFRTWGGFTMGFGIMMLSLAAYMLTARPSLLRWGTSMALLVAFGRFLASNIIIHSDSLWFIAVLFGLAVLTAIRFSWRHASRNAAGH